MDELTNLTGIVGQKGQLTIVLVAVVILFRLLLVHYISKGARLIPEARRSWTINVRNSLLVILTFGLIFIWAPELRSLALSLVAIALALVLAFKEVIDCMSGAFLRFGTNAYVLGDRIEIAGIRGKVVDHTLLTTTVLEIGPGQTSHQYTGHAMVIPNSILLKNPLTIETYTKRYVLHVTRIPMKTDDDWQSAEKILLESAREQCRPYIDDAKTYMKKLEGRHWLDAPSVEPRVTIQLKEPGHMDLLLRVPCPPDGIAKTEQTILRRFLSIYPSSRPYGGGKDTNALAT